MAKKLHRKTQKNDIVSDLTQMRQLDNGTSHPIHAWPNSERPREKLANAGPAALSNAELLAIFFTRWGRRTKRG